MRTVICATTNDHKFGIGKATLHAYDISLVQKLIDIDEIQGEDADLIIRDKVHKAYNEVGEPVVVTDDTWDIVALNGFPGPYMKSVNHWFAPQDFIDLMAHKSDRRIFLHQFLAYFDGKDITVFKSTIPGSIVLKPRGKYGPPIMHVVTLDVDRGKTISETYDQSLEHDQTRLLDRGDAWRQLAVWLQEQPA